MKRRPAIYMLLAGVVLATAVPGVAIAADYHHVHLGVGSPTEAVAWYVRYMDCQPIPDRSDAADCGKVEIHFDALVTVGGSQGTGVNHISFSYADLTAKMGELERVGVGGRGVRLQRFDDGSTLTDAPGLFKYGFVFDPWGTRIELLEDAEYLGFHHVHLSSTDPEANLEWYQNVLGGERASLRGQLDGLLFDNVWLIVSQHAEGTPAATQGRAIDHIGFLVSDLDEAAAGMRQHGVGFEQELETGRTSARRAFIAGPDNVALAVVEPGWAGVEAEGLFGDVRTAVLESYTAPQTPWGTPDLQGIWTSNRAHGIPLERPTDLADTEELTPEEAAARRERGTLGSIWGYEREWRDTTLGYVASAPSTQVAMVVDPPDGRIPPLTPEAQARLSGNRGGRGGRGLPAGPEDLSLYVRCITRGMPSLMMPSIYNNGLQIVQSPGYVAIQKEMIHETRVIPTDPRPHLGENLTQWLGDSRGHWEGDTLVVEVTNFNGEAPYRGSGTTMKLIERYTRIGPDTLLYEFTVDDPSTWTQPWTAVFPFDRDDEQYELVEYACTEGNYGMTNILTGARAQEQAAEDNP
jgi:catechol 2,3-dioxygenase-like lactoylglutathione lyase family enzyme